MGSLLESQIALLECAPERCLLRFLERLEDVDHAIEQDVDSIAELPEIEYLGASRYVHVREYASNVQ